MLWIGGDKVVYMMDQNNMPAARAESGAEVVIITMDSYGNQITRGDQDFGVLRPEYINPATGPLYVEGAAAGDTLKVEILDIKVNSYGIMAPRPGKGVLGEYFPAAKIRRLPIENGQVRFNDRISLSIDPMIGVIGVAPAGEGIRTTIPGSHGGNLDCRRIVRGATVYLPVQVEGALLAIGDLHALMGDGEVVICGLEVGGEVTVRVEVIKGQVLPLPIVVDGETVMTIASAPTLDEAARQATKQMHRFLTGGLKMDVYEAGMLLSLIGNLVVCQVVNPLMTVRMELPHSVLERYQYRLP